ncbi:MAG TPA: hypothetical protein DCP90_05090 [Clostridiales bacterium]|nr:MAG: hypothetical protein A2Y22_07085 [Clostridiales bacterium GWD2_32_59]HAN09974.1 hypothetical protein [Clostridiales bacterium]
MNENWLRIIPMELDLNIIKVRDKVDTIIKSELHEKESEIVISKMREAGCLYDALMDENIMNALNNKEISKKINWLFEEDYSAAVDYEGIRKKTILAKYYGVIKDITDPTTGEVYFDGENNILRGDFVAMVYKALHSEDKIYNDVSVKELYNVALEKKSNIINDKNIVYYYAMNEHVLYKADDNILWFHINRGMNKFEAIHILLHILYPDEEGNLGEESKYIGIGLHETPEIFRMHTKSQKYEYFATIPYSGVDIDTYQMLQRALKRNLIKEDVTTNLYAWEHVSRFEAVEMLFNLIEYDINNNIG